MEMLRTADAAEITQTGRAYLQVGNNEVYELFQTAWSGADYQPEKDQLGIEDHTIYLINELGQYRKSSTKTSPVWIWQKKSRKCRQSWMSSCKKSTTCTNKKASQLWPNHGCHRLKSGSRWMSWTRSCRSRLGKKRTAPSVLIGVADIPQSAKAKKLSPSICQRWQYPPLRKSRYRKDDFPTDSRNGSGPQAESRKSDHVSA